MKYQVLIDSCKKAIEEGRCLGCQALEDIQFRGNYNCKYNKIPSAEQSIRQIREILGVQERLEL